MFLKLFWNAFKDVERRKKTKKNKMKIDLKPIIFENRDNTLC